jgi:hypothetical protein
MRHFIPARTKFEEELYPRILDIREKQKSERDTRRYASDGRHRQQATQESPLYELETPNALIRKTI